MALGFVEGRGPHGDSDAACLMHLFPRECPLIDHSLVADVRVAKVSDSEREGTAELMRAELLGQAGVDQLSRNIVFINDHRLRCVVLDDDELGLIASNEAGGGDGQSEHRQSRGTARFHCT